MTAMTYLTAIEDAQGRCIDFERWNYKRSSTVRKKLMEYLNAMKKFRFFQEELRSGTRIRCYATPDGCNCSAVVWEIPIETLT